MSFKHRYSNLTSGYKGTRGNSTYAEKYRSFSDFSRSEVTLRVKCTWLSMQIPGPTNSEVLLSDPDYA